ncbi:MAG: hypoxanthine phosphoribosyltransferase [Vampirovibrionales bacterium]|nr:hypoxanthine phosphoribosyltransferase [Vampirovibrionales bacterium]
MHHIAPYLQAERIQERIAEMAAEINASYGHLQPDERLIVVAVLKGSFLFLADLVRHLTIPLEIEFVRLASYHGGTQSSGSVRPVDLSLPNLTGKDVLIIEDIVDTGLTLKFFADYLQSLHQTRSQRVAVLLDKPSARHLEAQQPIDYVGFEVGSEFLVGYGLDYDGLYRNLPFIGVLQPNDL